MQDPSSLTGDRTLAPCTGSPESQALDHQGSPQLSFQMLAVLIPLSALLLPWPHLLPSCPFSPCPSPHTSSLPRFHSLIFLSSPVVSFFSPSFRQLAWQFSFNFKLFPVLLPNPLLPPQCVGNATSVALCYPNRIKVYGAMILSTHLFYGCYKGSSRN